jgi:hypothetical protein
MSLMGEQLAEEWLNRQGFFTIRGAKIGTGEIDLLAVRRKGKTADCWHYEVQASLRPISYITPASNDERKRGISAFNAKRRTPKQLKKCVAEWLDKKYWDPRKEELRKKLWDGIWHFGLIVGNVRHPEELEIMVASGIKIIKFANILKMIEPKSPTTGTDFIIGASAGADLVDLMFAHDQLDEGY